MAVLGSPFLGKGNDSFIWGGGNSPFFVDGEGSRVGEREYFFLLKYDSNLFRSYKY